MTWSVDANQAEIVQALIEKGASVQSLANVGKGVPDLLVGWEGINNFLMEVKNPKKSPAQRKLTEDQVKWHSAWRGQLAVVQTVEEALLLLEAASVGRPRR